MTFIQSFTVLNKHLRFEKVKLHCNNWNWFSFRSDVVREIFFHFTEVREGDNVDLGDDVEFTIQVFYLNT
jgi:hypothetical protein